MFGRNDKPEVGWLAGLEFFGGFSTGELEAVAELGHRTDVGAGTELIDQGRVGDSCYVIVSGRANVYIRGEYVATVGPGSMVGEMALVEHRPRNATVVAETDMSLVRFGIGEFGRLLEASPTTHHRVMEMLNERLRANESLS